MRRIILSFVGFVVLFFIYKQSVEAENVIGLNVISNFNEVTVGDEVTLSIQIKGIESPGVKGITLDLNIPEGLEYVEQSLEFPGALGGNGAYNPENNRIGMYGMNTSYTGNAILATLKFKVSVTSGSLNVGIQDNEDLIIESGTKGMYYSPEILNAEPIKIVETVVSCKHEKVEVLRIEPTCIAVGAVREKCSDCGTIIKQDIIEKRDHIFNENGYCDGCGIFDGQDTATVNLGEEKITKEKGKNGEDGVLVDDEKSADNEIFWIVMGVIGVLCIMVVILIIKKMPKRKK